MDKGLEYYNRYLSGDNEGMSLLIKEYSAGLTLYINSYVQDIHTAEELMIDTFVKIGVKRHKDRGNYAFSTLLYTIGRNLAIDYLRKHKSALPLSELEDMVADEEEIEDRFLKDERRRALFKCLKNINKEYANALWLFYFEGMQTKEVARVMGKTKHATENILSRARKSLKEELIKEGFSYDDL